MTAKDRRQAIEEIGRRWTHAMTIDRYRQLRPRDFENGAVRDEIDTALARLASLEEIRDAALTWFAAAPQPGRRTEAEDLLHAACSAYLRRQPRATPEEVELALGATP